MSLSTGYPESCEQAVAGWDAAVPRRRKSPTIPGMNIAHRFAVIALKKYEQRPAEPKPAVRMLLRNALRLAVAHLGRKEVQDLARETLRERP